MISSLLFFFRLGAANRVTDSGGPPLSAAPICLGISRLLGRLHVCGCNELMRLSASTFRTFHVAPSLVFLEVLLPSERLATRAAFVIIERHLSSPLLVVCEMCELVESSCSTGAANDIPWTSVVPGTTVRLSRLRAVASNYCVARLRTATACRHALTVCRCTVRRAINRGIDGDCCDALHDFTPLGQSWSRSISARASSATTPSGEANNGLMSNSTIFCCSTTNRENRNNTSTRASTSHDRRPR